MHFILLNLYSDGYPLKSMAFGFWIYGFLYGCFLTSTLSPKYSVIAVQDINSYNTKKFISSSYYVYNL